MKTHDFQKSIEVGKYGETLIEKYLKNHTKVSSVINVSGQKEYQDIDIDYVVHFKNGKQHTIELKTDTYNSGNIFYETVSNKEYNVAGCMKKSKADFLFYYFIFLHFFIYFRIKFNYNLHHNI